MSRAKEPRVPEAEAPPAYEQVVARLEAVVAELEGGGLTLEQSLARFAEGMALSGEAQRQLDGAERRIEQLVRAADGSEQVAPLEGEEGAR